MDQDTVDFWDGKSEPPAILKPAINLLAISFYVDTNCVDDESPAMKALRRAWQEGWLTIQRTDVLDMELAAAKESVREALDEASAPFFESHGPWALGDSRLGSTFLGSDEDAQRLVDVFRVLFPGVPSLATNRHHRRDAMHVSTAIRYAADAFITNDRRLLNKNDVIREQFMGFKILNPADGLALVCRDIAALDKRQVAVPTDSWVPRWRPDTAP